MAQHLYQRTFKYFNRQVHQIIDYFRRISFPGFEGVPIYNVFSFFFKGLLKGSLNIRASSIAFNFLLALGPGIIFLLTLIPYLPINNFRQELMEIMYDIIPENSYIAIESLLAEIFIKRGGLQIFGLLTAFFFAQKGVNGMIEAFNATYHTIETRPWFERRLISVGLVFILAFLMATATVLFIFSKTGIGKLAEYDIIKINITYYLLITGKWIIIVGVTFFSISFLYYLAPMRKTKWKFYSAGSTLATLLTILASLGFSYFVNHFAQFNKFFGSIGALIALMLWMNFNALTLLIGFELNASIKNARLQNIDLEDIDAAF
jgi:membrane protein